MINANLYTRWIGEKGLLATKVDTQKRGRVVELVAPMPNEHGLFSRGTVSCVLPYLRVYWKADPEANGASCPPPWKPETWEPLMGDSGSGFETEGIDKGFFRFMRADQLLDCLHDLIGCQHSPDPLMAELVEAMPSWLVPVDEPLRDHRHVLQGRIETVRLFRRGNHWRWSRSARYFPDAIREHVPDGLDPVHTPESARSGLTRYLCEGWSIGDDGRLLQAGSSQSCMWGPSTSCIPYRLHDAPRRLMLGASLQSRSVPLIDDDRPNEQPEDAKWLPPGRCLRTSFMVLDGWTHEDAVVISQSAALKLRRRATKQVSLLIPSVATRVELPSIDEGPVPIVHGEPIVRAFIDAFAVGLRRHEAEAAGATNGWIEVGVPGSRAPFSGRLSGVKRRVLRTPLWRELITLEITRDAALGVGDKVSTRHGIKGVVSKILPDQEMPVTPSGPAEIILSPLGIVRRGAMGQFREAAPYASELPQSGNIFIMRQPQDADDPARCRIRGPERGLNQSNRHLHPGQRYGEMEFLALMAHGAEHIAQELLSVERSTSPWVEWERKVQDGSHRMLATRALNRYFSAACIKIKNGRLENFSDPEEPMGVFHIESPMAGRVREAENGQDLQAALVRYSAGKFLERLEDAAFFSERGGLGKLPLGRIVRITVGKVPDGIMRRCSSENELDDTEVAKGLRNAEHPFMVELPLHRAVPVVHQATGDGGTSLELDVDERGQPRSERSSKVVGFVMDVDHVYVLPPWLRPSGPFEQHPLTRAYRRMMSRLMNPIGSANASSSLDELVGGCIRLGLDKSDGAGGFLRREVLGRRLTRSSRAVIVPRPDLRIDQIAIPEWMADQLFEGLPTSSRSIVLVNRNPTLHRGGLIALRPVIDTTSHSHVFGLPLGVLRAMGADFDGDQASIVALETEAALAEAVHLLPGSQNFRKDKFRSGRPAFPFTGELVCLDAEQRLANDTESTQKQWCQHHYSLQQQIINDLGDGWCSSQLTDTIASERNAKLWAGLEANEWRQLANDEMRKVTRGVRRKGQLGGVLRRELYRRSFTEKQSFREGVQALQAVTERMTQTALSVKSGSGATNFKARRFFENPEAEIEQLSILDKSAGMADEAPLDGVALAASLSDPKNPSGLLGYFASPVPHNLVPQTAITEIDTDKDEDPRISWFVG